MGKAIYQKLEYLDNGKAGNVISIGNFPGSISYCVVTYSFPELPSSTPNALFGSFAGKGVKFRPRSTASRVAWYSYSSYGTEIQPISHTTVAEAKYQGSWMVNSGWYFYKDGETVSYKSGLGYSLGTFQDAPIYVYGSNENGNIGESCRAIIYNLNISVGGTSVIELMPVKRLSDGICGFLNRKTGTFHSALDEATASEFTGPTLEEYFDENMINVRPATLEQKLSFIEETKGLIKQAIINKGVEVTNDDSYRSYADKITLIKTGELSEEEYNNCLELSKEILLLPEPEYTVLEKLHNQTGAYIDTGINPYGKKLKYEFKFGPVLGRSKTAMGLFGGFNAAEAKNLGTMYGIPDSYGNGVLWNLYGKSSNLIASDISKNRYSMGYRDDNIEGYFEIDETTYSYRFIADQNGSSFEKEDVVLEGSGTVSGEFPQTPTITLFCQNSDNGAVTDSPARTDVFYFKIYLDDIIVRDFIPVKDSDGTVCLYDKTSRTFFYAQNGSLNEGGLA